MSTTAAEMSWDDIKALFRETDRKFQETDRKFQETRELLQASANTGFNACDRLRAR